MQSSNPTIDSANENHLLATWLEKAVRRAGVRITEAEIRGADQSEGRLTRLHLKGRGTVEADFDVDAPGFRSD